MLFSEADNKQFRASRILALAMLVAAPMIYLVVTPFLDRGAMASKGFPEFGVYILLIVALAQGGMVKVVRRFQMQNYRRNPQAASQPARFFTTFTVNSLAIVESVFLFGLVVFIMTGDYLNLLWFYLIGAVWAVVYWPRREKFERFVQELQKS